MSDHPPTWITAGQAYVTGLINPIMSSKDWNSTAIFLTWDDSGGFYNHVKPPVIDGQGYGLRVPSLVISPYAKQGYIDHQVLSFDAYLKFIEDDFLRGLRLDPRTDGRRDSRPTVRENQPILGNLARDPTSTNSRDHPISCPFIRPSASSLRVTRRHLRLLPRHAPDRDTLLWLWVAASVSALVLSVL